MNITLVGKPDKVIERGPCVIMMLQTHASSVLPKGLPTPVQAATSYAIYMRTKQWRKVAQAITDPEDVLILEGIPQLDLQMKCIAVFATAVTTKKQKHAKRQPKQVQM